MQLLRFFKFIDQESTLSLGFSSLFRLLLRPYWLHQEVLSYTFYRSQCLIKIYHIHHVCGVCVSFDQQFEAKNTPCYVHDPNGNFNPKTLLLHSKPWNSSLRVPMHSTSLNLQINCRPNFPDTKLPKYRCFSLDMVGSDLIILFVLVWIGGGGVQ